MRGLCVRRGFYLKHLAHITLITLNFPPNILQSEGRFDPSEDTQGTYL